VALINIRWFVAWVALWFVGSLLVIHYALQDGTDWSVAIVFGVAAAIAQIIVAVVRRAIAAIGHPRKTDGVH